MLAVVTILFHNTLILNVTFLLIIVMTVKEYQNFEHIRSTTKDYFDCGFILVCEHLYKTPMEVDEMNPKKFVNLVNKLKPKIRKPLINLYSFQTNASKITLGQFIECITWLKQGVNQSLHLVGASILECRNEHKEDSEMLLNVNVNKVIFRVYEFVESFNSLVYGYRGLFGIEDDLDEEEDKTPNHPFIDQYGWIFSAKSVAEFLGITINEAYEVPILEALNTLSYLKSKQQYDKWLAKKR